MAKRYYKQKKYFSLQNETKQYIKRLATFNTKLAGADIANLDNFIAGLKQLNLWQNIVCWPMRKQYNIGTGTKLLSLGGLGTYDGTLFNSIAWNDMGFTFDGTSHYIEFNNPITIKGPTCAGLTMFAVFDSDQTTNKCVIGSAGTFGTYNVGPSMYAGGSPAQGAVATSMFFDTTLEGGTLAGYNQYGSANTGVMQTVCGGFDSISKTVFLEYNNAARTVSGGAISTPFIWNNNSTWRIGARVPPSGTFLFVGVIPFCLIANRPITRKEYEFLRDLHKITIGNGLGLP